VAGVTFAGRLLSFRVLAKKKKVKLGDELLEDNRKARFDFEILEELEAGVVLHGSEVKSIRDRRVSLKEAETKREMQRAVRDANER